MELVQLWRPARGRACSRCGSHSVRSLWRSSSRPGASRPRCRLVQPAAVADAVHRSASIGGSVRESVTPLYWSIHQIRSRKLSALTAFDRSLRRRAAFLVGYQNDVFSPLLDPLSEEVRHPARGDVVSCTLVSSRASTVHRSPSWVERPRASCRTRCGASKNTSVRGTPARPASHRPARPPARVGTRRT